MVSCIIFALYIWLNLRQVLMTNDCCTVLYYCRVLEQYWCTVSTHTRKSLRRWEAWLADSAGELHQRTYLTLVMSGCSVSPGELYRSGGFAPDTKPVHWTLSSSFH